MSFTRPALITAQHPVEISNCGNEPLNQYLRAVLIHAKDENAAAFYARFGFAPSPTDPLHLMLLIKDLRRTIGASGS